MERCSGWGIRGVTTGFGATIGRHGSYAERSHIVADACRLTSRVRDINIVVEDAHSESKLRQLTVVHNHIGLEAFILGGAHTWEVDTVLRLPIALLQVAKVMRHHRNIGTPLFEPYQYTHADGVYTGLSHAVEPIDTPIELRLHATRMILFIARLVIRLLKADYTIQAMLNEFGILFGFEWHHLNLQVTEVRFCQVERFGYVVYTGHRRVFALLYRDTRLRLILFAKFAFFLNYFNAYYATIRLIFNTHN